jgi:uncharacterized membrane protein
MNPMDNLNNYKFGIFYYNPDDPRTVVPKRIPMMGYTMNFARPLSYLFLVLILSIIAFLIYVLSSVNSGSYL